MTTDIEKLEQKLEKARSKETQKRDQAEKDRKKAEKEMLEQQQKTQKIKEDLSDEVTEEQLKELKDYTNKVANLESNHYRKKLSWWKLQDLPKRFRLRFKQYNVLICNFELNNSNHSTIVLPIIHGRVWFRGGSYVINPAFHYYNINYKEYCGDFHQGYNMQIERRIPVNEMIKTLQTLNPHGIGYASDPITLKTFQVNEIAKTGIQAAGISDFFKQVRLLVIISAISSTLMFLVYCYSQGYFNGIPGVGGT